MNLYMDAFWNFYKLLLTNRCFRYFNEILGDKYKLQNSTPSIYMDTVAAADINWPSKYEDLLLLLFSDDKHAWTGFFTSRPNLKSYIRKLSGMHYASSQLIAEALLGTASFDMK